MHDLITHQVDSNTKNADDIEEAERKKIEEKEERDNHHNLIQVLKEAGLSPKGKSMKKKGKTQGDKPIRVNPMRSGKAVSK